MPQPLIVVADATVPPEKLDEVRALCQLFAEYLGGPVGMAVLGDERLPALRSWLMSSGPLRRLEGIYPKPPPRAGSSAPMGAAPILYDDEGRPDWARMWTGFCELALFGGPPHRGEDAAIGAPTTAGDNRDVVAEIARGIKQTTGLDARPADEPGWIAIQCESRKMAAWMCATALLENIEARFENDLLLLPAAADFTLADGIKSVITVVAKTHHYWKLHVEDPQLLALQKQR
jgi:sirohydrochlorin cobaltochelatase